MPDIILRDDQGRPCGFMRVSNPPRRRCYLCEKWHTKLCDHVTGPGKKTCDRRLCEDHAKRVPPDLDYCPEHAPLHRGLFQ